jgi:hypothetical protein
MVTERVGRKLATGLAAVLFFAASASASAGPGQSCEDKPSHYGLFCNNGGPITICQGLDGCTAQCGDGPVVGDVTC